MDQVTLDEASSKDREVVQAGVFVQAIQTPQGLSVKFQRVGDVDPLSVPVMLELATNVAKQQLGLK